MSVAEKMVQKFSYKDYESWSDKERWEIIDGQPYNMSPAPSTRHQKIVRNISWIIGSKKSKLNGCSFFVAPTDVLLDDFNIVQPDIFVVCNQKQIKEKFIKGAPILVIEIVSPNTAYKDTKIKKDLYEKFGVKEYIIIYPDLEIAEKYILKSKKYGAPEIFNWDEELKLHSFDIAIELWEVFEKERIPTDNITPQ